MKTYMECETCKNFGDCGSDDWRERVYLHDEGKDCHELNNYSQEFPLEFKGDPNTAFINWRAKDTRTPYEQYEAGEKWIYVDFRELESFKDEEPETITREEYYDRYIRRSQSRHTTLNYYPVKNFKFKL